MDTKNMIETIKAKFEMIQVAVGKDLNIDDLSQSRYLRAVIDATEHAYVHLNDSICESLYMCKECAQKRDLLMHYLTMLDDIDEGMILKPETIQELARYPEEISNVIERIDNVLATHYTETDRG